MALFSTFQGKKNIFQVKQQYFIGTDAIFSFLYNYRVGGYEILVTVPYFCCIFVPSSQEAKNKDTITGLLLCHHVSKRWSHKHDNQKYICVVVLLCLHLLVHMCKTITHMLISKKHNVCRGKLYILIQFINMLIVFFFKEWFKMIT